MLSFPIPLRILFPANPQLLSPVLQVIHRVIATFLIKQAGLKRSEAHTGAVTLIQRFGWAANLNIHLHWHVVDGVYRTSEGVPVFYEVPAPSIEQLQALLARINGIYDKHPLERMFRDSHAAGGHISSSTDAHPPWGLVPLGGEFRSPTL